MNTTVSKSFGLALLLAVGIIAVMVAMGTFQRPEGRGAGGSRPGGGGVGHSDGRQRIDIGSRR